MPVPAAPHAAGRATLAAGRAPAGRFMKARGKREARNPGFSTRRMRPGGARIGHLVRTSGHPAITRGRQSFLARLSVRPRFSTYGFVLFQHPDPPRFFDQTPGTTHRRRMAPRTSRLHGHHRAKRRMSAVGREFHARPCPSAAPAFQIGHDGRPRPRRESRIEQMDRRKRADVHAVRLADRLRGFSVSASHRVAVMEYIANQAEHHRRQSFQDEFVALLRRYEIDFEEKYVFG